MIEIAAEPPIRDGGENVVESKVYERRNGVADGK